MLTAKNLRDLTILAVWDRDGRRWDRHPGIPDRWVTWVHPGGNPLQQVPVDSGSANLVKEFGPLTRTDPVAILHTDQPKG